MPAVKYKVHFGVSPENLNLVVPGVAGMDTVRHAGGWEEDWNYEGDVNQVHVSFVTDNPMQGVARVLQHYGQYLVPRLYDDDGQGRGYALILVSTLRDDWDQGYQGCLAVYAGDQALPAEVLNG